MTKNLLLLLLVNFSFVTITAQSKKEWNLIKNSENIAVSKTVLRPTFPKTFTLFKLDLNSIRSKLNLAQDVFTENSQSVVVEIPNSKGELESFKMFESSNFDPELQARFPEIRSYVGQSLSDSHAQVRLSISPEGLQSMIFRADNPNEYIEVYSADKSTYAVFNKSMASGRVPFTCSTLDDKMAADLINTNANRSSDVVFRRFRLAMSVTGEYSAYHGGTTASVLAAVNNTMTRVNGVFEKDLAIRMNLVNNTTILYLNAGSDPYGPTDVNYNSELQSNLDLVVGSANYDVGHLMSAIGNNGNAGCIGCVCDALKGSGYTTSTAPVGDAFDIDFVVHELGHQFGGNHTFTFSAENNSVNYEVGSGVTIMGYAGITPYDVALNSIDTFHAGSIAQIQSNMGGKTCDIESAITHSAPVVNAGPDFQIPLSTPFDLTGSATDAGGATGITYQWEQYNEVVSAAQLEAGSPASDTKTLGPNFRSYLPTASGTRSFPIISSTLAGSKTTTGADILVEALNSVARSLTFRLTARDNVLNGGQTNFDNAVITVANRAALDITSQSTNGISYPVNSVQTVTWTSAGNNLITGAANVDIALSTDNGVTWSNLLVNTPNDGSQAVTLPAGVAAPFCRFRVRANANIFYNINTKAFSIGFTVTNTCTTYNDNVPLPFVDQAPGNYTTRTLNIPTSVAIGSVNVINRITHTYLSDVQTDISSPASPATFVKLFNRSCGATDNTATGPLDLKFSTSGIGIDCLSTAPQTVTSGGNLASFNGQNPNGVWTFRVYDNFSGDTGTINSWGIEICTQTIVNLATEDFNFEDFSLYPNPNNGDFTIKFKSASSSDIKINVYDMSGRSILNKSYSNSGNFNQNITLDQVQAGIYLVSIVDGSKKIVKRIIVQ